MDSTNYIHKIPMNSFLIWGQICLHFSCSCNNLHTNLEILKLFLVSTFVWMIFPNFRLVCSINIPIGATCGRSNSWQVISFTAHQARAEAVDPKSTAPPTIEMVIPMGPKPRRLTEASELPMLPMWIFTSLLAWADRDSWQIHGLISHYILGLSW